MTDQPEPCIGKRCYSPMACGGFGYCRERNAPGLPSERLRKHWIRLAASRKRMDALLQRIADESGHDIEEVRAYVIEHAAEIFAK